MIDASYLKKLAAQTPFRVAAGIALVLVLALLTSDRILLHYTEGLLTRALATEVEIGNVSIHPLSSQVVLTDFEVRNPTGFSEPNIFISKKMTLKGSILRMLRGELHLRLLDIGKVHAWILKNDQGYNYELLLSGIESDNSKKPASQNEDQALQPPHTRSPHSMSGKAAPTQSEERIRIKEVRIQNIQAKVNTNADPHKKTSDLTQTDSMDISLHEIILYNVDLHEGGEAALQRLSLLITEALVTATARKATKLPLAFLRAGLELGGTTVRIVDHEPLVKQIENPVEDIVHGAKHWIHKTTQEVESANKTTTGPSQ
ncbi:MAG: hypothetical protein CL917_09475 [Deltaproteobacteria bacterium]|nr:hypothetical protein [Deltaproteobacteria bacterium]